MSQAVLLLGVLGLAGAALKAGKARLPEGERPFDSLALGVDAAAPLAVETVAAAGGQRSYKLTSFQVPDGRTQYVAELKGSADWVSYVFNPATRARALWAINAGKAEGIEAMARDFDLQIPEQVT